MKIKALLITLAAFLAILFSVPGPARADTVDEADEIVYYTNQERVSRNLRPLKVNKRLTRAAQHNIGRHGQNDDFGRVRSPSGANGSGGRDAVHDRRLPVH
ncbi:MAG: hypothetical protein LBT38_00160 [Deltaproteobacteria bacterium]|jgi:uncharacterized protein YkwD|nr:hypothetical protein [Deltaproteobacteria bacterium]